VFVGELMQILSELLQLTPAGSQIIPRKMFTEVIPLIQRRKDFMNRLAHKQKQAKVVNEMRREEKFRPQINSNRINKLLAQSKRDE
jgi:hypothetical protein